MQTISVIVPCYNEELVLPQLFTRLEAAAKGWGMDYEIVCVDDGSSDGTWELLKRQHQANARWKCLAFARNFGHQVAISAGLFNCTGDAAIIVDADLQDPPEELARLIQKWREGYEVVYGVRQNRKEGLVKRFCYWAFYRLMAKLVQFELPLDSGDFCLLDRCAVVTLNAMPERNRFVRGMRAWAGFRQVGLPYERQSRAAGSPKYSVRKLFKLAWDGISSFSSAPLRFVSYLGMTISGVSLVGILFTLCQRLFAGWFARIGLAPVPGFATIVISILFLGGVQLLCLGIVGEYVGRIYDEVKRRPLWTIRETQGLTPRDAQNGLA
jgi:polyisoprenyl-phosphate glycosyltransferase